MITRQQLQQRFTAAEKQHQIIAEQNTPAAVLIPIIAHSNGLTVLFTRRTDHLPNHAGQISFPGGRMEEQDEDLCATAIRETEEEIGLGAHTIHILGILPPTPTVSNFMIYPFVGLLEPPLTLIHDPHEVAEAFEVPLDLLLDKTKYHLHKVIYQGQPHQVLGLHYQDKLIWGATARIIYSLIDYLQ